MTDEEINQTKEFNEKWDMHKVISEAIANAHTQPAPQTLKMLEEIKATQAQQATTLAVQAEKHVAIDNILQEIRADGKETLEQAKKTNGRVTKLEDWSGSTKLIIEKLLKENTDIDKDVSVSKAKIWTAITVLMLLGGAMITLAIMAIDSKIEKGIQTALDNKVNKVEYATE